MCFCVYSVLNGKWEQWMNILKIRILIWYIQGIGGGCKCPPVEAANSCNVSLYLCTPSNSFWPWEGLSLGLLNLYGLKVMEISGTECRGRWRSNCHPASGISINGICRRTWEISSSGRFHPQFLPHCSPLTNMVLVQVGPVILEINFPGARRDYWEGSRGKICDPCMNGSLNPNL